MPIDKHEYPGGLEIRILLTPLMLEIIRVLVMLSGVGLLILIYCLL